MSINKPKSERLRRFIASLLLSTSVLTASLFSTNNVRACTPSNDNGNPKSRSSCVADAFNKNSNTTFFTANDSTSYPDFFDDYTFTTQAEEDVDPSVKPLWQNMQTLKNSETIIGPSLAKFSEIEDVTYHYANRSNLYGEWISHESAAYINSQLPIAFQLLVQVHETLHGMQYHNDVNTTDVTRSIRETQMEQLSCEAAAMVSGYLMAIELAQDSITDPWKNLRKIDTARADQILAIWDSLKTLSLPYQQALTETGFIAFHQQFKQQWWLDSYNQGYLLKYLDMTINGEMASLNEKRFTLSNARKTGYVSPKFNFTAQLKSLPSKNSLFGKDTRMRWAFDCAELYRVKKTGGKNSALYQSMKEYMEEQGNPYLELNMKKVFVGYRFWGGFMSLLDFMDGMKDGTIKVTIPPKSNRQYFPSK